MKQERRGEGKGPLEEINTLFPVKLDYLDVQMSIKGNLKRAQVRNRKRPAIAPT